MRNAQEGSSASTTNDDVAQILDICQAVRTQLNSLTFDASINCILVHHIWIYCI